MSRAGSAPLPARVTSAACVPVPDLCVGRCQPSAGKAFGALAATTPTAVTARTPLLASRRPVSRDSRPGATTDSSPETALPADARSRARNALRDGNGDSAGAAQAFRIVAGGVTGSNSDRADASSDDAGSVVQGACHSSTGPGAAGSGGTTSK